MSSVVPSVSPTRVADAALPAVAAVAALSAVGSSPRPGALASIHYIGQFLAQSRASPAGSIVAMPGGGKGLMVPAPGGDVREQFAIGEKRARDDQVDD